MQVQSLGSGRLPGEGNGNPLQRSCPENPVNGGTWWAAVHRVAQSRTRLKRLSMHVCIGEGNGNPLQYFGLENPRDRGAWWAAIYGVAQSWTRLKWLSSSSVVEMCCGCVINLCYDISASSLQSWLWSSLVAQTVKKPSAKETWVWSLGEEDLLEKGMTTHSTILAWRIPWTGKPMGCSPWGCKEWVCLLCFWRTLTDTLIKLF